MKNDFLKYIKSRGYLHQCTNDKVLDEKLNHSKVGYIGFDCTSDCYVWLPTSIDVVKKLSEIWTHSHYTPRWRNYLGW